jgi:DNA-binding response OmpR family regulator
MTRKVLLVDDDANVRALLSHHFTEEGFKVTETGDGERGCELGLSGAYDLIILDVALPRKDGLGICRELRSSGIKSSIIMLTTRGDEIDKVLGLELGADDYVAKPFSVREILARARAVLRRTSEEPRVAETFITSGDLTIKSAAREVTLKGKSVSLTATEFDLLLFFVKNAGRAFSRDQLLAGVWGYTSAAYEHTVNVTINRLRTKIERNPGAPALIQTVWGVGYKFAGAAREERIAA